jgi:hypothetical protein
MTRPFESEKMSTSCIFICMVIIFFVIYINYSFLSIMAESAASRYFLGPMLILIDILYLGEIRSMISTTSIEFKSDSEITSTHYFFWRKKFELTEIDHITEKGRANRSGARLFLHLKNHVKIMLREPCYRINDLILLRNYLIEKGIRNEIKKRRINL